MLSKTVNKMCYSLFVDMTTILCLLCLCLC